MASLYLVLDQVYIRRGRLGSYRKTKAYAAIQKGAGWMAKNFSATVNPGWDEFTTYYFYNCERVAAAAGMKYFGTHDWFREIAATLLKVQKANGAISYKTPARYGGVPVDTSLSLLFLAKGVAPVVYNKLRHAGDWDNHLRELAGLTDWLSKQSERPANWQIVNLKVPAADLTDSRILYIAGARPMKFSDAEVARLKRYVDLGGMLVFHPDKPSPGFNASARRLLQKMYPQLELTWVDMKTHPISKVHAPATGRIRLQQLASATRVRAFVMHGQPATAWARRQSKTARYAFDMGAALHYYANDRAGLKEMPSKLTYFAEDFRTPAPATPRVVTLARVRYGDNPHRWDPEPAAFERFARRLAAREQVNCRIKTVTPDQLASAGAKIAHLTGVDDPSLTKAQWDAIDKWLRAGGTLIVDQAGGPPRGKAGAFDDAFRKLIADRYGEDALDLLIAHPALKGLGKVGHRNVMGLRRRKLAPRLEAVRIGGREAIYYSRYDLTCGLLDCPNPLVSGMDGPAAQEVLSRLVLSAAGMKRKDAKP